MLLGSLPRPRREASSLLRESLQVTPQHQGSGRAPAGAPAGSVMLSSLSVCLVIFVCWTLLSKLIRRINLRPRVILSFAKVDFLCVLAKYLSSTVHDRFNTTSEYVIIWATHMA